MTGLPELYAVLDADALTARGLAPLDVLAAWLDAGVRCVQVRAKTLPSGAFVDLAAAVAAPVRAAGGLLIINDRADIAQLVRADGVHVGQSDLTPADVRRVYPGGSAGRPLVGLSTHAADQVADGLAGTADYLAIGPVYPTGSKADAESAVGLDGVRAAAALTRAAGRPLVAIGGITAARAPEVLAAGADSVAVISALLDGGPAVAARAFLKAISA